MFLPWLLRAWHRTRQQHGQNWTWIFPAVGVAGIVCTGSRTPVLGAVLVLVMGLMVFVPQPASGRRVDYRAGGVGLWATRKGWQAHHRLG